MSAQTPAQGSPPVGSDEDHPAPSAAPVRSARRQFAATILALEAFVVLFGTLVAFGLRLGPAATVWVLGVTLAVSLLLVSGLLRWPAGYVAGSVLQVPLLVAGLLVPAMFVVGGIFAVLWVVALRLGGRIDTERAERAERAAAGA